jgi:hypothetical protein
MQATPSPALRVVRPAETPLPPHFDQADDNLTAAELRDAEEDALDDVDSYQDWLGGECANCEPMYLGYVPLRDKAELAAMVEAATMPKLVRLQLYPNAAVSFAASQEIVKRYLTAKQAVVLAKASGARS